MTVYILIWLGLGCIGAAMAAYHDYKFADVGLTVKALIVDILLIIFGPFFALILALILLGETGFLDKTIAKKKDE